MEAAFCHHYHLSLFPIKMGLAMEQGSMKNLTKVL